jgi:hypothetical protein
MDGQGDVLFSFKKKKHHEDSDTDSGEEQPDTSTSSPHKRSGEKILRNVLGLKTSDNHPRIVPYGTHTTRTTNTPLVKEQDVPSAPTPAPAYNVATLSNSPFVGGFRGGDQEEAEEQEMFSMATLSSNDQEQGGRAGRELNSPAHVGFKSYFGGKERRVGGEGGGIGTHTTTHFKSYKPVGIEASAPGAVAGVTTKVHHSKFGVVTGRLTGLKPRKAPAEAETELVVLPIASEEEHEEKLEKVREIVEQNEVRHVEAKKKRRQAHDVVRLPPAKVTLPFATGADTKGLGDSANTLVDIGQGKAKKHLLLLLLLLFFCFNLPHVNPHLSHSLFFFLSS